MEIRYRSIGVIHTPFKQIEGMPIQPAGAAGVSGQVEIWPEFVDGLDGLEGFSHVYLLYHLHRVEGYRLQVTPFLDQQQRGLFATRAPSRPNPIGLSVVKLVDLEGGVLHIENVDILDGTPLLDLKPYVPRFDDHPADRIGWLEGRDRAVREQRSDDRFA